jgi:Sad1 / UNC-like C-terminal
MKDEQASVPVSPTCSSCDIFEETVRMVLIDAQTCEERDPSPSRLPLDEAVTAPQLLIPTLNENDETLQSDRHFESDSVSCSSRCSIPDRTGCLPPGGVGIVPVLSISATTAAHSKSDRPSSLEIERLAPGRPRRRDWQLIKAAMHRRPRQPSAILVVILLLLAIVGFMLTHQPLEKVADIDKVTTTIVSAAVSKAAVSAIPQANETSQQPLAQYEPKQLPFSFRYPRNDTLLHWTEDCFWTECDLVHQRNHRGQCVDSTRLPNQRLQPKNVTSFFSSFSLSSMCPAVDRHSMINTTPSVESLEAEPTEANATAVLNNNATAANATLPSEEDKVVPAPLDKTKKDPALAVDYASKAVGGLILEKSGGWKGTSNLLASNKDLYAMLPSTIVPTTEEEFAAPFLVIGLSEDILVKQIVLANYERYSSSVKEFQIAGSQKMIPGAATGKAAEGGNYTSDPWIDLGKYKAERKRVEQVFDLVQPAWVRYLRIRVLTRYGDEHYLTISQISVHGITMVQGFHEHWEESEIVLEAEAPSSELAETTEATIDVHSHNETTPPVVGGETAESGGDQEAVISSDQTVKASATLSLVDVPGGSHGTKDPLSKDSAALTPKHRLLIRCIHSEISDGCLPDQRLFVARPVGVNDAFLEAQGGALFAAKVTLSSRKVDRDWTRKVLKIPSQRNEAAYKSASRAWTVVQTDFHRQSTETNMFISHEPLQFQRSVKKALEAVSTIDTSSVIRNIALMIKAATGIDISLEGIGLDLSRMAGVVDAGEKTEVPTIDRVTIANDRETEKDVVKHDDEKSTNSAVDGDAATPSLNENDAGVKVVLPTTADAEGSPDGAANSSSDWFAQALKKYPSASCLKDLDWSRLKEESQQTRTGGGAGTNVGGAGSGSSNVPPMEPIFKKLADEIRSLQASLALHDQLHRKSVTCYQRVMLDMIMTAESEQIQQNQRLQLLEEMYLNRSAPRWPPLPNVAMSLMTILESTLTALLHLFAGSNVGRQHNTDRVNLPVVFVLVCFLFMFLLLDGFRRFLSRRRKPTGSATQLK